MRVFLAVAVIMLVAESFFLQAQSANLITAEMRAEANTVYQASEWAKAAAAYEKIVALEPENVGSSYRLGIVYLNLNQSGDAQKYLDKVFASSPNAVFALALARAYAQAGNKAKAFEIIEKSTKLGGIAPETLTAEKDFDRWKTDADFQALIKKSDLAVNPCKASVEFRQFDFWIGEWEVKNPQGVPSGTSSVQLILGECTIFENWSSAGGSNGKSFNIYDRNDKKWHQTWVSDKGTFTHYIGGLEEGNIVLVANTIVGGNRTLAKMTFSKRANGDVRQFGENSTDDGKTWTTAFDLIYVRIKKEK